MTGIDGSTIGGFTIKSRSMDDALARFLGRGTGLHAPIPSYPTSVPWKEKQGKGVYEIHVGKKGKVENVKILKSSQDTTFDRIAVRTLRQWRLRRGPLIVELPSSFTLTPTNYAVKVP